MKNDFLKKWEETSVIKGFCISVFGGLLMSIIVVAISFLIMIFKFGNDGMRYSFLHLVYFNTKTMSDGSVDMNFGTTGHFLPAIIMVLVFMCFIFAIFTLTKKLLSYRVKLLNERNNTL